MRPFGLRKCRGGGLAASKFSPGSGRVVARQPPFRFLYTFGPSKNVTMRPKRGQVTEHAASAHRRSEKDIVLCDRKRAPRCGLVDSRMPVSEAHWHTGAEINDLRHRYLRRNDTDRVRLHLDSGISTGS